MAETTSAETAVRRYLTYLENPASLVDDAAVARAETAVESAKDALDRLKAVAALERARQPDARSLTRDFIANAKAYAETEDISTSAFRAVGVPTEVLANAGFAVSTSRRAATTATGTVRQRAPKVPVEQIKRAIASVPKRFTLNDLAEKAGGGSQATVRKAVQELIKDGRAKELGPMQNHKGRGRAPTEYELS